jgi:hypothetical protein
MIKEMHNCEVQTIFFEWSRDDIKERARYFNIPLSEREISTILWDINDEYDPEIGVSWNLIDNAIIDFKVKREYHENC